DFVTDGQIRHESPRSLTFQFGPGQTIDAATLDAIRVYRAGHDGTFNPASAVSDLNTAGAVQLQFEAARLGPDANGTAVVFLTQDFGGPAAPVVTTLGSQVIVTLNTNEGRESTAQEVVSAINSDPDASSVLQ